MCIPEQLQPVDFKKRVLNNLDTVNNAGADMPDDADIFAAALNDTPLDGDFLQHAADNLYEEESDEPKPWDAYEEIFTADTGIARRDDRTSTYPTADLRQFVIRWYMGMGQLPDPVHEIGTQPTGFFRFFAAFIRGHLPAKLDLNSWVGDDVMAMLSKKDYMEDGVVVQWRPWMGTNQRQRLSIPPGFEFLKKYVSFVGTPGEGRLVWRQDQWGVLKPTTIEEARRHIRIKEKLRRAESHLVGLSIRIANWLAWWLVNIYAHEIMHEEDEIERRRLRAREIPKAVIEILGDEWFELPFDRKEKLKSWKNKRDMAISGEHFTHIIRDGSDPEYTDDGE
jgi:hypothetical protein